MPFMSDKARSASVLNGVIKNDTSYEFIDEVTFKMLNFLK